MFYFITDIIYRHEFKVKYNKDDATHGRFIGRLKTVYQAPIMYSIEICYVSQ